ncbi:putative LmbE-like protein [Chitinispirillum alkaliphilum]|nr:putative LmbE-like protein [Chitinispirillum alkaliphilum]
MNSFLEKLCCSKVQIGQNCLIIAAHPDDEIMGMGSVLSRFENLYILYLTDGVPRSIGYAYNAGCHSREQYSRLRQTETQSALNLAMCYPKKCFRLGLVDQESCFQMPLLVKKIARLIDDYKIDVVFTHPYEGGHPDHDTASFALWAAKKLLRSDMFRSFEFTSYFGVHGALCTNRFLGSQANMYATVELTEGELKSKRRMVECFPSQKAMLNQFDLSTEQFRETPRYRYLLPPHSGTLFYEYLDWGVSGRRWRAKAEEAMHLFGIEERECV